VKEQVVSEDFTAFFADTCPGMLAKAIVLSGHRQDAEDAVQEAYTEALRAWPRIADYESPEAWVYKVMRQRLWAASRRASRQVPSGVDLKVPAGSLDDPERTAEVRAVIVALGALPGKMRLPMVMHCLNGTPQGEVAHELGLARGTVGFYVHSARRLLEKQLGLTAAGYADQQLVRVAAGAAAADLTDLADPADQLVSRLRAAESWLRAGLEDDVVIVSAIGAAVTADASGGRRRDRGSGSRWRLGRGRSGDLTEAVTDAGERGSQ
jgi:RNA polymerase sigma factor (sigma-70 family)